MDSRHNKSIIHCISNTVYAGECVLNNPQIYKTNSVLPIIANKYPSVDDKDFCSSGI